MNAEHPLANGEHRTKSAGRAYDLQQRLLTFSVRIVRLVESLPKSRAGNHIAGQLLRSGTSPLPNHGEAQAAESAADFVHKLSICLKELRETHRWLLLVREVPLVDDGNAVEGLLLETDELVRIFKASVQTAKRKTFGQGPLNQGMTGVERRTLNSEL